MKQKANKKLGQLLLEYNYITPHQLEEAIKKQKSTNKRLGDLLIDLSYISEEELIEVLKVQLGFERVKLGEYNLTPELAKYVTESIAKKHNLVPFSFEENRLHIAMSDPSDLIAIDDLKITTDYEIKTYITTRQEIEDAQDSIYSFASEVGEQPEKEGTSEIEVSQSIPELVQQIIKTAAKKKASDIHIEPEENKIRIRYRINGVLQKQMTLSRNNFDAMISHCKVRAGMDVAKNRIPQSGRIRIQLEGFEINARVSTLPTLHGEKMVIRLLLKDENLLNINNLGFSEKNLKRLKQLIEKPHGIVLVTGPSSSGKTTTLFASINYLNKPEVNIVTIEDPIEYQLKGIYQVQTSSKPNLDFPQALRSVLRQDPEIIMIGEIRDKETAEIAVNAAVTGHLVLSTMHSNDTCSTIGRLRTQGIPSYLIYSALRGVIAQRLVRTLCRCKKEYIPGRKEKQYFGIQMEKKVKFYKPGGCSRCGNTGYKGRTTIQEVLLLDDDYEKLIADNASKKKIEKLAKQKGLITLKEHAKRLVIQGITSYQEIKRVIL